ncbi:threonine ammonia-lyase IlvA [Polaribacter vadi]|uniref:threonine ammonia-lyase IlvA n=1 Tax=Polaribacter TaxID=52959 RepID=UPI001C09A9B3|nr:MULTISPECIES: threonine ammonia-lyase IlvA [Polaribacter]MBU3011070.1 threonine ammonia-lyase IlvA [Polaribacter vadi]MDO6740884.1 threonine ammonia-lyase IlvA [Polaribacter sp. 1_MG-2023]
MQSESIFFPSLINIKAAAKNLEGVATKTPLTKNSNLSKEFTANVFFKREDLQVVRSYKIRGAYNKMFALSTVEKQNGIVCASAGNHAQGVALSCKLLQIKGTIFMPSPTPNQKIEQVKMFGEEYIDIVIGGDTFDDAFNAAKVECDAKNKTFIHPFNDEKVIEGQATVGLEILEQTSKKIDYVFVPIGGGGLSSGLSSVFKLLSPETKIIGIEPEGAPAMLTSINSNKNTALSTIDPFVDGAAVKKVGDLNFAICQQNLHKVITVPEGKVCQTILNLYNKDAIVVEPAGALSIAALDFFADEIKGKNVVCVVSGSNNDITRTEEIKERALVYADLKHYFIIKFPQRAGALKEFVVDILGPDDDITHFEYTKKNNRIKGAAVVGLELQSSKDLQPLIKRMKDNNFFGDYLNDKPDLFQFLV